MILECYISLQTDNHISVSFNSNKDNLRHREWRENRAQAAVDCFRRHSRGPGCTAHTG